MKPTTNQKLIRWGSFLAIATALMIFDADFLLNNVSLLIGLLLGVTYIPQIRHLRRNRCIEGISIDFWIILNVALSLSLFNAIAVMVQTGVWGYLFIEIINEGLALYVLLQVLAIDRANNGKR